MEANQPTAPAVADVDEEEFEQAVVARSRQVPVLVDFWAPWCGPCRRLGPVLERVVGEHAGALALAKVNSDDNQALAASFGVRGIPHVLLFKGGEAVDGFVGAMPEEQVRAFLRRHVAGPPDPAAAEADAAGRAALAEQCQAAGGEAAVRARIEADAADLDARVALGVCLGAAGRWRDALEELLAAVRRDRKRDEARKAMLGIFQIIGVRSPLADEYREKLALVLH